VICWGGNQFGQLGNEKIAATGVPARVYGNEAKDVAAGGYHTCILLNDNTVKCLGYNFYGQLGNGTNTELDSGLNTWTSVDSLNTAHRLAAGRYHTCALLLDKRVVCWGYNDYGQLGNGQIGHAYVPTLVPTSGAAIEIAAGRYHT
jgi:alpha-tubulin suppressor-like RCC1 family protein